MANLSKQKREKILQILDELKEQHKDEETIIALNEIKNEINSKKYGLVWEKHEEKVDIQMKTQVPVFTEIKEKEIKGNPSDENYNFVLEGDNLHSLKLLEKTYKEKVDVIYIDPPYNTQKSGFTYNDKIVDITDGYRHSKWISFMNERLCLAKGLLTEKGVIFISIDNSELYNLKLLCDDLFGEDNFVGNMVWRTTTDNNVSQITTEHEYILCYAKQREKLDKWTRKSPTIDVIQTEYERLKEECNGNTEQIQIKLRSWIRSNKEALEGFTHYDNVDEYGVFHDGDIANTVQGGYKYEVIHPITHKPCKIPEKGFRFTQETMNEMIANNNIMFGEDETTLIKPKVRLLDNLSTLKAYYYEDNRYATKRLEKAFGQKSVFSNPKSTNLIKQLISYSSGSDALVLDFFAGSGTTAEAVLELNKEDGGKRRFILCTNNEISGVNLVRYLHDNGYMLDYNPNERTKESTIKNKVEKTFEENSQVLKDLLNKPAYFEYGICRFVTYQRLKVIISGKTLNGERYSDGCPANVKYFITEFIDKTSENEFYSLEEQLSNHIKEMIELENGISIDNEKYIMILTDEEADELEKTPERIKKCERIYVSGEVLLTQKQENLFKDKDIITIPQYYFEDELMEVGEL